MSEGEKMIWAAAFVFKLYQIDVVDPIQRVGEQIVDESLVDRIENDPQNVNAACDLASKTVERFRSNTIRESFAWDNHDTVIMTKAMQKK